MKTTRNRYGFLGKMACILAGCFSLAASAQAEDMERIRTMAREFMNRPEVSYLSTIDDEGYPVGRLMINLRNANYSPSENIDKGTFVTYFASGANTDKIEQIKANGKATVFFFDPALQTVTLLLIGKVEIVTSPMERRKFFDETWTEKYPRGSQDPNFAVLKFTPVKAKYYNRGTLHRFDIR